MFSERILDRLSEKNGTITNNWFPVFGLQFGVCKDHGTNAQQQQKSHPDDRHIVGCKKNTDTQCKWKLTNAGELLYNSDQYATAISYHT